MAPTTHWLTVSEAAEALGVSERTVQGLVDTGRLRAAPIGGALRIDRRELEGRRRFFQWTRFRGEMILAQSDSLSRIVMEKVAARFGLALRTVDSGEALLDAVAEGGCALAVIDESLSDMPAVQCYAGIRALNFDLPAAICCRVADSSRYWEFVRSGGPVLLIQRPIQFRHAYQLMRQLGFPDTAAAED